MTATGAMRAGAGARAAWNAVAVLVALALGLAGLAASPRPAHAQAALAPTAIFARVSPAVPVVETPRGHGTGFMFDATHVMTDAHVVEDFETVSLRFPDGKTYPAAKVVVRDRLVDMALVEIPEARPVPTVIADSPTVIGSEFCALGYPGFTNNSPLPIFSRGLLSHVTRWDSAGVSYLRTDARGEPGTSGGPILDEAGRVVGVIQFGTTNGAYMIAASAVDLKARAERHLAGEDVDGIARRVYAGPQVTRSDVALAGGRHPDESFSFTAVRDGRVTFDLDASDAGPGVIVTVLTSHGDWVAGTLLVGAREAAKLDVPVTAGQRYWLSLASEGVARVAVSSELPMTRLVDGDERRAVLGRSVGLLDHGADMDCRPIALRAGQVLTARAESIAASPLVFIASPGGAIVRESEDSGEGVRGTDTRAEATAVSDGDFFVCVSASVPGGSGAGYILTLSATPAPPRSAGAGTFALAAARLGTAREAHVAIALADGRVLIAGGLDAGGGLLSSAEIYDPARDLVTPVAARDVVARRDATPALLRDGRVLIVGGVTEDGVTDAASVFDPATGAFTSVGPLGAPRLGAEAIVLDDGRVLIVTGSGVLQPLATAELFDPATSRFTPTDSMSTARSGLVAAKLADGRVLISGGVDETVKPVSSAEIFDPATSRFTRTGSLDTARFNHISTLLPDGRVLITGGTTGLEEVASAELYDPATGTFRKAGAMLFPRQAHAATLLPNGRVLVTSGIYRPGSTRETVVEVGAAELYDPGSGRFTHAGALRVTRVHVGTPLPDGRVVFAGGSSADGPLAAIEVYTPGPAAFTGPGTLAAPPVFSREGVALAIFEGGSVDQLEAAAKAAGGRGAWVQDVDGTMRLLVVDGPPFLAEPFREAFAGGLAPATPITLTR